jgi:predicted ATPase/transcriptional regulator with XRE-family HTH domain
MSPRCDTPDEARGTVMASAEPHPFAQMLKHHRVAAGLTQEALAERAGLSARSISDMERGLRSAPYQDTIHKLAGALGLSAAERARFEAAARRRGARIIPHPATVRVLADALGCSDEDRISFLASARENAVPSTHAAPAPHRLPLHPTPLLGREREVAELGAQLRRDDVRLLTLTGAGGVGKTRLAIEAATQLAAAFADGAWFVPLSRISDPELVLPAIAHTLELKESGATPLAEVLHRHLRDKELLLVLDNFEHLLAAALSIGALLASCPGVKVLVTSRVALRLQGEREYALRPLALPDPQHLPPPEHLAQHAAVALFIERAQAAKADFRVTPATAPAVVAICARLDGLPLAIELAAARVKLLSPSALLQRLERSLLMLTGGPRDLDKRQQTMRNTLAWSYNLLSPEEQVLFRRLAVFAGGCNLEAAEAICVAPDGVEPLRIDVFDGLAALVDQGLVQRREEDEGPEGDGAPRFGMLYVIREYALEQLDGSGEAEALARAHGHFFLNLAIEFGGKWSDPDFAEWIALLEREQDNLRASLAWAIKHAEAVRAQQAGGALTRFWDVGGYPHEGFRWLQSTLQLSQPSDGTDAVGIAGNAGNAGNTDEALRVAALARADALAGAGDQAWMLCRYDDSRKLFEECLTLCRAVDDPLRTARALFGLGRSYAVRGELDRASAFHEEALMLSRRAGQHSATRDALAGLGMVALLRGDLTLARARFEEALAIQRDVGDEEGIVVSLWDLGEVALQRNDLDAAEALAREALVRARALRHTMAMLAGVEQVGRIAAARGLAPQAVRLLAAAQALSDARSVPFMVPYYIPRQHEAARAATRLALGDAAFAATAAAGRALSLEEAIAEALGEQVARDGARDERAAVL